MRHKFIALHAVDRQRFQLEKTLDIVAEQVLMPTLDARAEIILTFQVNWRVDALGPPISVDIITLTC